MKYVRPMYSVVIIRPDGKKFTLKKISSDKSTESNLITSLQLSESKGQLAEKAVVKMYNHYIDGKGYPSGLFPVKSRIYIYARGGGREKTEEVFRGYVWEAEFHANQNKELSLVCYDNLIYFMKSEIVQYFSKGKSTREIVETLMKKRGVNFGYNYSSITHPKLPLSGTLADVLTSDILGEVEKKKGVKYTIKSVKGKVCIDREGSNETIYRIGRGEDGILLDYSRSTTLEGVVTRVVITGKTDENGKTKVEAKVDGNRNKYGTLTKVVHKDEDTKLSEMKDEAKYILDENGAPHKEYDVTAMDIPWIRKGDKISLELSKGTYFSCIVEEITHKCDNSTMELNVKRA